MKKTTTSQRTLHRVAAAALTALAFMGAAKAESFALVMTTDYKGVLPPGKGELPGIDKDGEMAIRIAESMGVPRPNIRWLRNGEMTLSSFQAALQDLLNNRMRDGDKVFLYYSGHGYQEVNSAGGNKCSEGMVTHDLKHFQDDRLRATLDAIAAKASQVVMLNDSCFSGGAATKDMERGADGSVPKFYQVDKAGSANDPGYTCGQETNKDFATRTLGAVARQRPSQMLYVAAAADNEVSRASNIGSWATLAWAQCLSGRGADADGNGLVDGNELRQCAQTFIDRNFPKKQTISLVGNASLLMSFAGSDAGGANAPVARPDRTLETLRAAADPSIKVGISVAKDKLSIGKDLLDFSVSTDRDGYLHLLHVGTDGKFYVLYPNRLDSNNYLKAGTHRFPRATWGIQAQGPAGTGYIMAYLSTSPKDFTKGLAEDGAFATGEATEATARKLGVVALNGRYGASTVVPVREVK